MKNKRFKTLRVIFDEASEMNDAEARAAFVSEACAGDESLHQRVQDLLRAHVSAGGFLRGGVELRDEVMSEGIGSTLGRYKLLEKLGEGGCGAVYQAQQMDPVKRSVALKVIKLGMDTRSVIARFEAERQALALMDHPNIAMVLDAGATESGRPYFVMELVRGLKITDYCDQNNLSTRERLGLFVQVCQAIQHAHQKGVIHRDIKPSNILVTQHDGVARVKVIDFGIAKATSGVELTDKTLFTQFELLIGTPAYMSPEQAEMRGLDIDTRSDIYSLGVLLYELLTGRTPFDTQALLKSGFDSLRRTIRETEPARPSTRLRTLAAADLTIVANLRQSEPLKLISLVRGDLDWIVLKALEKDRSRRYGAAGALAADVQRHLDDEPVGARPPSGLDVFQKWVRRHKVLFAAGGAVAAALVIGLGISTVMYFKERLAHHEADDARRIAFEERMEADNNAEESRQRLVRLNVSTGNRLVNDVDWLAALPWFVEALRLDAGEPLREDVHRRRVAAVLRAAPRLAQFWMHDGFVSHADFSPDGLRVVSTSMDHTTRTWDVATGEPSAPLLSLETDGHGALYSPDGRRVLTVDERGRVRFWDANSAMPVGDPFLSTAGGIESLAFSPDGREVLAPQTNGVGYLDIATGTRTGRALSASGWVPSVVKASPDGRRVAAGVPTASLQLWHVSDGSSSPRLLKTTKGIRWFVFSHDGRRIAAITLHELYIWDVESGETVVSPIRPGGDLFDCRFSPDDRWVATASWDGRARVFDAATGLPVGDSMRHQVGVGQLAFSPDGSLLATASWDCTARLWSPRTGEPASPSLRHAGYVMTAKFSPDGSRLVTASQDRTARLWEFRTNSTARLVLRHAGGVVNAEFSPEQQRILTCSRDGAARIWNPASGELLIVLEHGSPLVDGKFSSNGRRIVTAGVDGVACVWDATTGHRVGSLSRHQGVIRHVEFSPDASRFLTASEDCTARIWDTETGASVTPPLRHARAVRHAAFSPDGGRVVTAADGRLAQIWDARTGVPIGPALTNACDVSSARFSPDGRRIVTAASDVTQLARSASTWNAATGQPDGPPLPHIDGVIYAEFSPDGKLIATASEDKSAAVWDARTGQRVSLPMSHRSYVLKARFSPDSRLLLTVSHDGTARIWDAATGDPVTPPLKHAGNVVSGAWSPDGEEVITASEDGTARVWDVSPERSPLEDLRRKAELLSGQRLLPDIGTVPLTAAEMRDRWEASRVRPAR